MLREQRQAMQVLLQGITSRRKPALRRSDDPDALLATDLPLVAETQEVARFCALCRQEGWHVWPSGGWLLLDHALPAPACSAEEMQRLLAATEGDMHCCLSLLLRHPEGGEVPPEVLRALLKAEEAGIQPLNRFCRALHGQLAEQLRLHQPLPDGLLPYLCHAAKKER